MEFKVGDRVKVLCSHYLSYVKDDIGVIASDYGNGVYIRNEEIVNKYGEDTDGFSVSKINIELIESNHSPFNEDISKPRRYNNKGVLECWDVIIDQEMNFLEGSILKYLWRYKEKGGVKDLEKIKVYVDKLILELGKEAQNLKK